MRNKRLVIDSIYYTIGEILPRVIGFFLLPLVTRYLTPAEYGIYSYTNSVMVFSLALITLSLNTFLLRHYYKEGTPEDKRRIIGNIFLLLLLTNVVVTALEFLVFPRALVLLKIGIPFRPYFLLAIVNNFLEGITVIPFVIYRIRQNARMFVLLSGSRTFLQLALTALLLSRWHYGLSGVYLGRTFVGIPYTLLFLWIVFRNASFRPDAKQMRKALRFSLPLLPGVLSYLFISAFDRMVLEKNVSLSSLGLYSTAATLALALNFVVTGLYRAFEQKLFEKHGQPEYETVKDELYRYFLAIVLAGGFVVSIFSREILLFFTSPDFLPAYTLVVLLVVPVILNGLITFLGVLVVAEQRQQLVTKAMLWSVAVSFPVTLVFIRLWGIYGAVLSSGVSFGIVVFYYLYHLKLRHPYVMTWVSCLVLLVAGCEGMQAVHLPLVPMLLIKLALAAGYLGICVYCFKVRVTWKPQAVTH
jgi:O-antigen/teichoic acid export membrane protein